MLADVLRFYVLGRLLLGPASVNTVYEDLRRLAWEGLLPAEPTLAEVVDEVSLFEGLGLLRRVDGVLVLVEELLPEEARSRVEEAAALIAERLGTWTLPAAAETLLEAGHAA